MDPTAPHPQYVRLLWAGALAGGISWAAVGALRRYALGRGVVDTPQRRSSHVTPTPRGGGAGLVFAAIVAFVAGRPTALHEWTVVVALLAVVPTAIAGWIDDHESLPVLPRLAAHLLSGVMLLPLAVTADGTVTQLLLAICWVGITISAINVVNFMDGIDGLIGLQALVFGIHVAVLAKAGGTAQLAGVVLACAALGFLIWNWSPSKIFLGDVGSGSVAVVALIAAMLLLRDRQASFLSVFLPLYPIFLDATVTILRRARRKEPLHVAHRSHLYQRLANEGAWGHARVSVCYGTTAAVATLLVSVLEPLWATGVYIAGVTAAGAALDRRVRVIHAA
jgi:UDP-N-acetylmuramyl pentapeptide phosphotransferase/UDP-N-acetylglucosamine-1-phosphate transferase